MSSLANETLPPELVEEILLRLPAESLVRFRLVCKSWRALVNDRSFVNKHLRVRNAYARKNSSSATLILMWSHVKLPVLVELPPSVQGISLFNLEDSGVSDDIACDISEPDLPRYFKTKLARVDIDSFLVGTTSNGVICLTGVIQTPDSKIILCNPALRRVKSFSPPFADPRLYRRTGEGFAYDSRADDYKFFRIYAASYRRELRAFVYTLGTNSWREIKIDDFNVRLLSHESVFCGGVYYWRSIALDDTEDMVIAFNVSEDTFRGISLPDGVGKGPLYWNRLSGWKDRVVAFNLIRNSRRSTVFEMWTMVDDKSGCVTWTKDQTVGPLKNTQNPLAFWNDDELLMGTMERDIVSYNLSTKKLRKLPIGDAVPPSTYHFEFYSDSLVSLKSRNEFNPC